MVYCNLIKADEKKVIYAIGGRTDDLTGKLIVNLTDRSFDLEDPKESKIDPGHIGSMLRREWANYENKVFREKISHEI